MRALAATALLRKVVPTAWIGRIGMNPGQPCGPWSFTSFAVAAFGVDGLTALVAEGHPAPEGDLA